MSMTHPVTRKYRRGGVFGAPSPRVVAGGLILVRPVEISNVGNSDAGTGSCVNTVRATSS